jgi:uncharacterized phage protein (TIGR02218 family)
MKTIPEGLEACGTLAFGVRIVRKDGTILGWTDHDEDKTVTVDEAETVLYANPGFTIKSFVSSAGLSVDNTDIVVIDGDDLSRADILARKWDGAAVYFFRFDWKDPEAGIIPVKRGSFGNFSPKLGHFVVEFRDLRQPLQHNSTWVIQEACRWRLGDARCAKDLTDYTFAGVEVSGVSSDRSFSADSLVQAADFFGEGRLTFAADPDGGANAGLSFKVKTFSEGVITLVESAIFPIVAGDQFTIIAGCRHRLIEDCRDKFDNVLNYGGEPYKPTSDGIASPGLPTEIPSAAPAPAPSAPAPPVPAPPPSAPTSRPLIVGLDYSQSFDASNIALHAKFDLSIRGPSNANSVTNGVTWTNAVLAANPDWELAIYMAINEAAASLPSTHEKYAISQRVNAQDGWVYNEPTGAKCQWTTAYGNYEVNITSALPSLSGKTYLQWKVEDYDFPEKLDHIPDATHVFIDNYWHQPRVVADYNRDGTNESKASAAAAFRAGFVDYGNRLIAERPGLKLIANSAGSDLGDYSAEAHIAFDEGTVGKTYGQFATGGIAAVRTRMLSLIANTGDGVAILNCYGESTNYQRHRFAYCMAALFDAGICCIDDTPQLVPVHIDEFYVSVGARVGAIPSAATENGIWSIEYEGALFICNPSSSTASIDVTAIGAGLWKRIDASAYDNQDPTTNSGANVTTVSLASQAGLLLVPQ